jgi:Leucine-rich repeat (LRR) protein
MKSVKRKSVKRKSVKRKSVKMKSVKRKSVKRKSVKRKSVKRKSVKRKSVKRKSVKRKSVKRKSVKRKSVKRKSVKRKSVKRKSVNDGMDTVPSELPVLPTPPVLINLEKYIDSIDRFYNESFISTISTFRMYEKNYAVSAGFQVEANNHGGDKKIPLPPEKNDTYDFIIQMFNFDNFNRNFIYKNKHCILDDIIVSGFYDEFEELISRIGTVETKEETKEEIKKKYVICSNRDKKQLSNIKHYKKINIVENVSYKEILSKASEKNLNVDKIKTFIFYSVCIKPKTREMIMRHYLLSFIKSSEFRKQKQITISTDFSPENKGKINNFLLNIGHYKPLEYITIDYKKNGKIYTFSTCGETTLLNLLNFYFIGDYGTFNIKDTYSSPLISFYRKYTNMMEQLENEIQTTNDWLNVVSNLDLNVYDKEGDIIPNKENIEKILKIILNSDEQDLSDILTNIKNFKTEIRKNTVDEFEILVENIILNLRKEHAYIKYINSSSNKKISWDDSDCNSLYERIFHNFDYNSDYISELSHKLLSLKSDNKIIKRFFLTITKINLQNNNLTELPESFGELTNLTTLNLQSCKLITELPESFGELTNLKELNLSYNNLTKLPERFGELKNLTTLNLQSCKLITELPESFGELTNLKELNLSYNNLTKLPERFGELKNLTTLNLQNNNLTELPERFGELKNLTTLDLFSNILTELPERFGELTNLTTLDLFSNILTELPERFGELKNLTTLDLSYNKLTKLPERFGELKNLTTLNLRDNKLTKLPERFGELTNLTTLDLSYNKLTKLPERFGELKNLTTLNLRDNKLTELPERFGELTNLTTLDLSYNKLTKLPERFGELKNLTTLDLIGNIGKLYHKI